VTVAHAATSQGPVAIRLYRARYLGHAVLCIEQVPQGNGQCASYPIGPTSKYARSSSDLWLLDGGHGLCKAPRFEVITAIVLHPGLTAWLRTPQGRLSRMATARVPKAFGVTGPVIYAVLTEGPGAIILRDARGRTAYVTLAVSDAPPPGTPAYCGGLNPDTTS
jgi:hypothetical protein